MNDSVYTIILHHPARPSSCLMRTLLSLQGATKTNCHVVDVIVQGVKRKSSEVKGLELRYAEVGKNIGIGGGFKLGVKRFLKSNAKWLLKVDDDIVVPRLGADILRMAIKEERSVNKRKLGGIMMATKKTRTRILVKGVSTNNIPYVKPVDGRRGIGKQRFFGCDVRWIITDFTDIGCTLYSRELFDDGCIPDEALFVGGIGLDLVLQGDALGYSWAVCINPQCDHYNLDCHTDEYRGIRSNRAVYRRSLAYFYRKWGIVPIPLATAAGKLSPGGKIEL